MEEQALQQPKPCRICKEIYTEAENKFTSCTYHDGFLFMNAVNKQQWRPLTDIEIDKILIANVDQKRCVGSRPL